MGVRSKLTYIKKLSRAKVQQKIFSGEATLDGYMSGQPLFTNPLFHCAITFVFASFISMLFLVHFVNEFFEISFGCC